jgi:hypothetical protein
MLKSGRLVWYVAALNLMQRLPQPRVLGLKRNSLGAELRGALTPRASASLQPFDLGPQRITLGGEGSERGAAPSRPVKISHSRQQFRLFRGDGHHPAPCFSLGLMRL